MKKYISTSFISFFIYCLGLISLTLIDVFVTRFYEKSQISIWVNIRSLFAICSIFVLIGFDQLLIRRPDWILKIKKIFTFQVVILSFLVGCVIFILDYVSNIYLSILFVIFSTLTYFFFQIFRLNNNFIYAQLVQQLWKILTFIFVVLIWFFKIQITLDVIVVFTLFLTFILAILMFKKVNYSNFPQINVNFFELYKYGVRMMVASLLLALSVYGEFLILGFFSNYSIQSYYFSHAVYFLMPVTILNGFFTFQVGPWIRNNGKKYIALLKKNFLLGFLLLLIYILVIQFLGLIAWYLIFGNILDINYKLSLIFSFICFFRTLEVFSSSYISFFANISFQDKWLLGQGLILTLSFLLFYIFYDLRSVIFFVAFASLLNWIGRALFGFYLMKYVKVEL